MKVSLIIRASFGRDEGSCLSTRSGCVGCLLPVSNVTMRPITNNAMTLLVVQAGSRKSSL